MMNLLLELTKVLKPYRDQNLLLAVSGGLDSMVLFESFLHFRKNFGFHFSVAYFHHGPSEKTEQLEYRNKARQFVHEQCQKWDVPFFCNWQTGSEADFLMSFSTPLRSEADFRKARYQYFDSLVSKNGFQKIVLAHHRDDLLETRLLKLLRGVGPDSFEAMGLETGNRLRPLLGWTRKELHEFATIKDTPWLEDPSNDQIEPMRNWLRQVWLKDLEAKWPGSCHSLGRSLDLLVHRPETDVKFEDYFSERGLDLAKMIELNLETKRRVIANYMRGQGLKDYGQSHINELLKRLDMEQKSHTFRLLGRRWVVDAGRMSVEGPA